MGHEGSGQRFPKATPQHPQKPDPQAPNPKIAGLDLEIHSAGIAFAIRSENLLNADSKFSELHSTDADRCNSRNPIRTLSSQSGAIRAPRINLTKSTIQDTKSGARSVHDLVRLMI